MWDGRGPYHHGVDYDGSDVLNEALVFEGVGRLEDDRGQQEEEESLGVEL